MTDLINRLLKEGGKQISICPQQLRKSFNFLFLASSFHSTILLLRIRIEDIRYKGAYKKTMKIKFLRELPKEKAY